MTTERKAAANRGNAAKRTVTQTPAEPQPPAAPYIPTAKEAAVLETWQAPLRTTPRPPKKKATAMDGTTKLAVDHPDAKLGFCLLMEALETADRDLALGLLEELVMVTKGKGEANATDAHAVNFGLSVIAGVQPRDHLEGLLATQMAAVHLATMTAAMHLFDAEFGTRAGVAEKFIAKERAVAVGARDAAAFRAVMCVGVVFHLVCPPSLCLMQFA